MSAFSITTATNNVQIGKERRAAILFTVTNQTGQALTGRAAIATVPPDGAHGAWVAPPAQSERSFSLNGVQDYTVEVNVPAGVPAGDYTFRLDMVATHNPDETYTAGPTVVLTVVEQPQPRRYPRWLIPLIVAIVVILVVGGLILFLLWPRGTRVPNVVDRPATEAQATVTAAGLVFEKAGEVAGEEVPAGIVLGTTPEAGERVREGTPVLYVESGGPAERPVPDVVGLAVDDALATLEAEGFRHRPGGNEFSEDVTAGLVAHTDPGAGTPAALDSRVDWFQSSGPSPTETPTATPCPPLTVSVEALRRADGSIEISWSTAGGCPPFSGELTGEYVGEETPFLSTAIFGPSGESVNQPPVRCEGRFISVYTVTLSDAVGQTGSGSAEIEVIWIC